MVKRRRSVRRGSGYTVGGAIEAYNAAATMANYAKRFKKGFSNTTTRRSSGGSAMAPMTSQHDSRLVYRKKSMPKRKRRRWVSFKKKVTAVEYSNRNLQNVTTAQLQYVYAQPNRSSFTACMMYGINGQVGSTGNPNVPPVVGSSGTGSMDDMYDVLTQKYAAGGTALTGRKFLFGSAVMDIHLTNIGDAAGILEIYEIVARQTFTPTTVSYDGPEDLFIQGYVDYATIANTPITPSAVRLGTTPFNCKLFCQYFTIKSKRRVHITPGEVISLQMRDAKNHFIAGNMLGKPNVGWRKGECKGYFFQVYGAPRFLPGTDNTADFAPSVQLKINTIKSYSFKQLDSDPIQYGHQE